MESVIKLKKLVDESNNIVVFTGAGISAESGIPTYRGKGGYWDKYDPDKKFGMFNSSNIGTGKGGIKEQSQQVMENLMELTVLRLLIMAIIFM